MSYEENSLRIGTGNFFTRNRELNRADQGIFDRDQRIAILVPGWLAVNGLAGDEADGSSHAVKVRGFRQAPPADHLQAFCPLEALFKSSLVRY